MAIATGADYPATWWPPKVLMPSSLWGEAMPDDDEDDHRLPADVQRLVRIHMIDEAVRELLRGTRHRFGKSTDYDVLADNRRFPPKAVFGLALEKALNRQIGPRDFSAGRGAVSFQLIEAAGYPIVLKGEIPVDDEPSWAEGSRKLKKHLRRERAAGLSDMKKRHFREQHGKLFCERCEVIPSETLGEFGDACIEVHHAATQVGRMAANHRTRLSDLQCLCANCHRIVHREMAEAERAGG